ncbi:MAG TPA: (2Fe-2S)-binding protein [Planctomycetaceae bacterium]|nr:(2Fe-2S)-binding protein [Planctomycetaceae bacterium]
MKADDNLCLCFHVSWRKVINYTRVHRVKIPSQLAECQGAGTGCGWCIAAMKRIVAKAESLPTDPDGIDAWLEQDFPASADYAEGRKKHIADKNDPQSD